MANKQVKTQSGLTGWQGRLQDQYSCYNEWCNYDELYCLSARLGFSNAREAWDANPIVQGSVKPEDYCRVLESDELPVTARVVVELQVDADESVAEWEILYAIEQAVQHAMEYGEKQGHVHDFADKLSISLVSVDADDDTLKSGPG